MAESSSAPNSLFHPLSIGGREIPGNVFLAPLAGYSDRAFREICRRFGASFSYTEMVSAEAIARGSEKSLALMERGEEEKLLGIQIFLSHASQAERALPEILRRRPTLIDINCGCPVPKVVKTGAGAALMQNPGNIYKIVSHIASSTEIPVTVKIRSGWDENSLNYVEAGRAAVEAGAQAVGLHARTRAQGYSGTACWEHIADLASILQVPVIGSGDLFSPEDIKEMLRQTRCSALMCARGAVGNPFIFSPESRPPSPKERLDTALRHYERACSYDGETAAFKEMKKHFAAYAKGLPEASALRNRLMRCRKRDCYRRVIDDYLANHGE
jgi:tRNA-dihydrouridine synthase B